MRDNRSTFAALPARILDGMESTGFTSAWSRRWRPSVGGLHTFPTGRHGVGKCVRITNGATILTPEEDETTYPAQSFLWVALGFAIRTNGATTCDLLTIKDTAANSAAPHAILRMTISSGLARFSILNADTAEVVALSEWVDAAAWNYVEALIGLDDTEGVAVIRIDQVVHDEARGVNLVGDIADPATVGIAEFEFEIDATGSGNWIELDDAYLIHGQSEALVPLLGDISVAEMMATGIGIGGQTWDSGGAPNHHGTIDEDNPDDDTTLLIYPGSTGVDAFTKTTPDPRLVPGPVELTGMTADARLGTLGPTNVTLRGIIGDLVDFRTARVSAAAVIFDDWRDRSGASTQGLQDRRLERQHLARMEVGIQGTP